MNRKIAYAIPNIFTVASLISALVALSMIVDRVYISAVWLITLSMLLDGFDGKVARLLNATSKIGAQADSLSDFVAFGVIPGFFAWTYGLKHFGFIGFLIFIVYILCGGFRLARFNVLAEKNANKEEFVGLPIPAAAAIVCSFIYFSEVVFPNVDLDFVLLAILPAMSYLMVSNIPYMAVNKKQIRKKHISMMFVAGAAIVILAILHFAWMYLICSWVYVCYGLFNQTVIFTQKRPRRVRRKRFVNSE
jgi:CDP-diacylglycerol--serine O-phosphatidyltransferase